MIMSLLSRIFDLCYPRDCVSCGLPAGDDYRWLCDDCAGELPLTGSDNCCMSCGLPFDGEMAVERQCPMCVEVSVDWQRGKTLMLYDGPAVEFVRHFKYNGERCLLDDVRKMLLNRPDILDMLRGSIVVPVPLTRARERERGFNQSEWLASLFADESGASCQNILRRIRETGTQTALSPEDRRKNVRGAFEVAKGVMVGPQQKYVLVDDVITTGATLNACASAIRKAGAKQLAVLTLAHA